MYIARELQENLVQFFRPGAASGLILAGAVGCGKTTLIRYVLTQLDHDFRVFSYTGDDVQFRQAVASNTRYLHEQVSAQTTRPALIFIDEVQKSGLIFDAVKYAFDHTPASFIISGSNPAFLQTEARKRLQRRAELWQLAPFSLGEILAHAKIVKPEWVRQFREILFSWRTGQDIQLPLDIDENIKRIIARYLSYGGFPLVHLAQDNDEKLLEIRKIVERGFELMSVNNDAAADTIKQELARLHSREFTYQGVFQRTGLRRRDQINKVIDALIDQGYLLKKKPLLSGEQRRSYLSNFSYIDPGIVTYLTGEELLEDEAETGLRVEGYLHNRLRQILQLKPLKTQVNYYKPFSIDVNNKVKYGAGEIDFVISIGQRLLPLEAKAGSELSRIDTSLLVRFIRDHDVAFGVVAYGGLPYWDDSARILYWPYWLV
ncbi:MAG: AAA family ATPase [Gammaproteobacteria bacterium]|nr:AAA family ATPase [Gammaproteobacteria bacterium]